MSTKLPGTAGIAGFLLAVLGSTAIGRPLWEFPGTDASAAELTAFLAPHRSAALAGMALNTVGVTLWLVFGAGVWLRLRRAAGRDEFLPACFGLGLAGFTTLILAGFVPFFVLAQRLPAPPEPSLLYDLTFGMLAMSSAPTVVACSAYAAVIFRTAALPRWTAWLAAVAAAAHVVLLASLLVDDGFFSLEGQVITVIPATLFIWILGTGIAMLSQAERPAGASSAAAA